MKIQEILEKIADINYDLFDNCKIRSEEYSENILKVLMDAVLDGEVLGIYGISQDEAEEIQALILDLEN